MRFPLLVNASPSTISSGPFILVRSGSWKVESDHRDSKVSVVIGDKFYNHGDVIEVSDYAKARVEIHSVGREKEINVFLVRK